MFADMSQQHPEDMLTYFRGADLAFAKRNWKDVEENAEAALARLDRQGQPQFLVNLGLMLLLTPGQRSKAEAILEEAAELIQHGDPTVHIVLSLLEQNENPDRAAAFDRTARILWPGSLKNLDVKKERLHADLVAHGIIRSDS